MPFERAELDRILHDGVANSEVVDIGFEPLSFSRDLVPATSLKLREIPEDARGSFSGGAPSGTQNFYTWHNKLTGYWSLYFYVPRGTKVVGGFAFTSQRGAILDSQDRALIGLDPFFSDGAALGV
ncbi:MAG TPA: hypothetical protein PLR25_16975, partial [Planctomycetaceae bacterium]|nr:hypothetical protein [Planctomycetaceae bacterium]